MRCRWVFYDGTTPRLCVTTYAADDAAAAAGGGAGWRRIAHTRHDQLVYFTTAMDASVCACVNAQPAHMSKTCALIAMQYTHTHMIARAQTHTV